MLALSGSVRRRTAKLSGPQLSRTRAAFGVVRRMSSTSSARRRSVPTSSPETRMDTGMPTGGPVSSGRTSMRAPAIDSLTPA